MNNKVDQAVKAQDRMQDLLDAQRAAFGRDMNPGHTVRSDRLGRLLAMTVQHEGEIAAAIASDFGHRSRHETVMAETFTVIAGARHARRHLRRWMREKRVTTPAYLLPGYSRVLLQPLGVVGIISPWNYPYQLALAPAIGALAAGNRVMVKPSEFTPRLAALLKEIVAKYFADDEMAVILGDADAGRAFAALAFDHLLFTGSTAVGREVAVAAARNLTPVTLELGGKSPAILDPDCDLARVAQQLAMGKLLNAGQTCIAPDYALVPESRLEEFVKALSGAAATLYPSVLRNPDYSSIASERQFRRLHGLIDDARSKGARVITVNPADERFDDQARKLPLTLLLQTHDGMRAMQEEIFGPILPVVTYARIDEAIAHVNQGPRPLALYWFGDDTARRDRVLQQTLSGGVTVNDTLWHFCQENLPFGGVGASGSGAYHGEQGFLTFSRQKGVYFQRRLNAARLLYPPYGPRFEAVIRLLKRIA